WIDHPISQDEREVLFAKQDSREVVVKHFLEDLDYAYQNITESAGDGTVINKWTALGLKTRVALFEGTFRKYHALDLPTKPDDFFKMVVDAAIIVTSKVLNAQITVHGVNLSEGQLFFSNTPVTSTVMLVEAFSR